MSRLCFTFVRLERHEAEDSGEVSLSHCGAINVFVSNLSEGTHGVLSQLHVLLTEGLVTHRDRLDHANRAGKVWLESLLGKSVGEGTETVGDGVLDHLTLSVLTTDNFDELASELSDSRSIILEARVVGQVAPEAEDVEELRLNQTSMVLQLRGPVGLAVGVDDG